MEQCITFYSNTELSDSIYFNLFTAVYLEIYV